MIDAYVETSGESPALARAEVEGALRALGGRIGTDRLPLGGSVVPVSVADAPALVALAHRLALARRVLTVVAEGSEPVAAAGEAARAGGSAAFRRWGNGPRGSDGGVREAGAAYVRGGGSIDLEEPQRRFWLLGRAGADGLLMEEVGSVDRRAFLARAMPRLPFRRPISLAPRLARASVNLAAVRAGDRVLDPFVGTGALLAEAALLGARAYGIDRDPAMVRGALRNFRHLGVAAEALAEGDAASVEFGASDLRFEAVVTDPPYGRSAGSGGEEPAALAAKVLARWSEKVVDGGSVVAVVPGGPPLLAAPWVEELDIPVRVHRSLTRRFRRYRRAR